MDIYGALLILLGWVLNAIVAVARIAMQVGGGLSAIYLSWHTAYIDVVFVPLAAAIFAVALAQLAMFFKLNIEGSLLPFWVTSLFTRLGAVLLLAAAICWLFVTDRFFTAGWAYGLVLTILGVIAVVGSAIVRNRLDSDDRPQHIATHVDIY